MFAATFRASSLGMPQKVELFDNLFENPSTTDGKALFQGFGAGAGAPDGNALFQGFGAGAVAPNFDTLAVLPEKAGAALDAQRASLAPTECPSSFAAHSSFDAASSSFGSSLDFMDLGAPALGGGGGLDGDDLFADLKMTSSFARRAQALTRAAPPSYLPPPPPPFSEKVLSDAPAAAAAAPRPTPPGLHGAQAAGPCPPPPGLHGAPATPPPSGDDDEDDLPSLGARLHAKGECTPCKFFRGRRGCKDGKACRLCHHNHDELTYSGIRRMMRKKALESREAAAPAAMDVVPPPMPMVAPPAMWRPPPGLPEPEHRFAPSARMPVSIMSSAYMAISV